VQRAATTAEIIISIDSDCIFHPNAIRELTACFAEPGMGSVGGRVGVRNPNQSVITAIQTIVYYSAFQLYKIPENWTRSICCISGCLFAIRRKLLLEIEPAIRARHWFGIPVNQGEDRFLTHQTLLRGYGTYINNDALCWTTVPNTLSVLFKQQLRWRRSIVRDFFFTLKTLPQHVWKMHPNTVLTLVLTPLGALVGFLVVLTMLTQDPLAWVGPIPLITALGIGAVRLQTTRIKLEADRADTQSKITAIYVPLLSDKPLKQLVAEKQHGDGDEQKALDRLNRQNNWDVALSVGVHQQVNPVAYGAQPYGAVSVNYNFASRAINKHLDRTGDAYGEWKKLQEGDVVRTMEVLHQQLLDSVVVQEAKLKSLQEEDTQIGKDLQSVANPDTSTALDFHNQLSAAQLLLQIETGDARFRITVLSDYLARNY
jgi:glycosyl transferase family 2